jgi:hypothetical protein
VEVVIKHVWRRGGNAFGLSKCGQQSEFRHSPTTQLQGTQNGLNKRRRKREASRRQYLDGHDLDRVVAQLPAAAQHSNQQPALTA